MSDNVGSSEITAISLFSGAAGLDMGAELAGLVTRTVVYVEREAYACEVLASRMDKGDLAPAPIWTDVSTFRGTPFRGLVDCVLGGFPCQDISVAGKQAGITGERSGLWKQFKRIIGEVQPRLVLIENVAALKTKGLDVVLADLAELGFDAEWGTLRASDVGATHSRNRMFILAYARRLGEHGVQPVSERGSVGSVLAGRQGDEAVAYNNNNNRLEGIGCGRVLDGERASLRHDSDGQGGKAVAYDGAGRGQVQREAKQAVSSSEVATSDWTGLTYPPGPDDEIAWRRIVQSRPDLEPAIRRVADGLAHRLDRLRLTGNGVVPAQAAEAFRQLDARCRSG